MFRATLQEPAGDALFKRFSVNATPTILLLDGDGAEVDWVVGYDPPAEAFQELLAKMKAGGPESYKWLSAAYANRPKDVEAVFALAQKKSERYPADQVAGLYKQVVALDPDGKAGTTEYRKEKISYTELAEFKIGQAALQVMPPRAPDPAPLLAFVKKYPESAIVKEAFGFMANFYFGRTAPKADAVKFFDEYTARYPQDAMVLWSYVRRIIADKDSLDKGVELARRAADLAAPAMKSMMLQSLAQVYLLKDDKAKAAEVAERILKEGANGGGMVMIAATSAGDMQVQLPPGQDMGAMNAARIFVQADRMDRALAIYGPEYLKKNLDKAQPATAYASFWSSQNANLESAREAALKATAATPDSWSAWNILGQINLKLKRYDDALKAAEKAFEIAPAQPPQFKDNLKKTIDQIKAAAAEKK
jgi:tetratricopeptide (TPR) repeat protein